MRKRLRTAVSSSRFRWIASALTLGLVILAAVLGLGLPQCVCRFAVADTTIKYASTDSSSAASALEQKSLRRVKVESVTSSAEVELACYPGTTKAGEDSALAFRVSGPLVDLNVKPGDRVSRGDLLMQIDPRDFKLAVKAAQATLDSAQAKLSAMQQGARAEDIRVLEANMAAAEARCEFLQSNQVRYTKLLRDNAISHEQMESVNSELKATTAQIRALDHELQKALAGSRAEDVAAMKADIRGMETQLSMAQDALADTRLLAPFDGTITRQLVENFEQVAAGRTVVSLHNASTIEIDVDLPEKELVHRSLDQPYTASVCFEALGDRCFEATLHEMSTQADAATNTYKVTFAMQAPTDVNILPGMVAEVKLESRAAGVTSAEKLLIPGSAVQGDGRGLRYVWVVDNDSVVNRRSVQLGWQSPTDRSEVRSGLVQNERIVTSGASFLHDGEQILVDSEDSSAGLVSTHPIKKPI